MAPETSAALTTDNESIVTKGKSVLTKSANSKQAKIDRQAVLIVYVWILKVIKFTLLNKPAGQAAGAHPSRCNSTNRKNPQIQQN